MHVIESFVTLYYIILETLLIITARLCDVNKEIAAIKKKNETAQIHRMLKGCGRLPNVWVLSVHCMLKHLVVS